MALVPWVDVPDLLAPQPGLDWRGKTPSSIPPPAEAIERMIATRPRSRWNMQKCGREYVYDWLFGPVHISRGPFIRSNLIQVGIWSPWPRPSVLTNRDT